MCLRFQFRLRCDQLIANAFFDHHYLHALFLIKTIAIKLWDRKVIIFIPVKGILIRGNGSLLVLFLKDEDI